MPAASTWAGSKRRVARAEASASSQPAAEERRSSASIGTYAQSVTRANTLSRPVSSKRLPSTSTVQRAARERQHGELVAAARERARAAGRRGCTMRRPQRSQPALSGVTSSGSSPAAALPAGRWSCVIGSPPSCEQGSDLGFVGHRVGAQQARGDDRAGGVREAHALGGRASRRAGRGRARRRTHRRRRGRRRRARADRARPRARRAWRRARRRRPA